MALLADVAHEAGVSLATASRALRDLPGVAWRTRVRVLAVARDLGYVLPPVTLTAPSARVLVVVPRLDAWFFSRAVHVLVASLQELGCSSELMVKATPEERDRLWHAQWLARRVHGVLVAGVSLAEEELARLLLAGVPAVGLHSNLRENNIGLDDVHVGRTATEHLIGLGHERIAMVTLGAGIQDPHCVPESRSAGFHEALEAAGLEADPALVTSGGDDAAGGRLAMGQLLARSALPTAVFAHSDELALGVISALRGAGLRSPADISVVSVDGSPLAAQVGLTSVAQDVDGQAHEAAALLVGLIRRAGGLGPPPAVVPFRPPPQVVLGATTARPPITTGSRQ